MRTNEERIAEMHKRAAELEKQKRAGRVRIIQALSVAACFVAAILMAVYVPGVSAKLVPETAPGSMNASIFAGGNALGYIVIAVIAFLLGTAVTIFCFRLKKWQDENDREKDE